MGKRSIIAWIAAVFLMLASSLAGAATLTPAAQKGLTWLSAQIQADGSLASESVAIAAMPQSRSEAAFTLAFLAAPSTSLTSAIIAATQDDTEFLARRIYALSGSGSDVGALVAVLKSRQNADGGFSAQPLADTSAGGFSSVLDSAWSLLALTSARAGGDAAALTALDYLLAAMDADGGMPGISDSDRIQASALSLLAFSGMPPSTALAGKMNAMAGWLVANQRPDGSWLGDGYLSGIVLSAILPVSADPAVRSNARNFLAGLQSQDGSWQGDPFLTAVVLRALVQDGGIPTGPATRVIGKVVDSKGGALLAGATVTLTPSGGTPLTATTAADGTFSFEGELAPGDYAVAASKTGYAAASLSGLTVVKGQTKDAGTFALAQNPTSGVVRGTVGDGDNGKPLAGAAVELKVSGYGGPAITLNAVTDASGNYEFGGLQLPPPFASQAIFLATLNVTLTGYQSATSSTKVVLGSVTVFSPALYPATATKPTSFTVSGKVVDPAGVPLAGVTISSSDTSYLSGKTALDGSFSFSGNPTLFSTMVFTLPGFQPFTQQFTPPAGGDVDLGVIVLTNLATSTSISGKVKNQFTGAAISGATLRLSGGISATTDASGAYAFNNLAEKSFTLTVTAPGYIDEYWTLNVSEPSRVSRDFLLAPVNANLLNLSNLVVTPNPAALNADVTVTATVTNPQITAVKGVALLQLVNAQGTVVDTGSAFNAAGTLPLGFFSIAAGQSLPVLFKWNTSRFPPGNYSAVVRIVAPQTMNKDRPLGIGLAMANSGFAIAPGRELSGTVTANPAVMRSGFDIPVALSATIQNSGNVALPNQSYRLSLIDTSDGHVAATRTANSLALPAGSLAKLDFGSWVPNAKGVFKFSVTGDDGTTGTVAGSLDIGAPAQTTFALDRTVVPTGTQTVRANLRLNDARSLSGYVEDPLKGILKQAVQRAARYNDNLSATWTHNNQCFGCHVQAQTLVGGDFANKFAPSYDKAQREKIYRGIVDYRQLSGTFGKSTGLSDEGFPITSAAFGAWSLAESAHVASQESIEAVLGALGYLKGVQDTDGRLSDKEAFTNSDTNIGWMDKKSNTPLALRALGLVRKYLQGNTGVYTQLVPSSWLALPGGANKQLRGETSGNLLVATQIGTIERVAPDGGHTVLTSSLSGRMDVGPDGSIYYLGASQKLTRQSPGGALTTINAPIHYASGIAVGPDGNIYYGAQVNNSANFNAIRSVTPSGQISDYLVNEPLFNSANAYMGFGPSGELVVTTGSNNAKLLRIWPDKRSEIVADYTGFGSVIDIQWSQGAWWVTTNTGVYRYDSNWQGGFVPNLYYKYSLSGGGTLGTLSGFAPLTGGRYALSNSTTTLYRIDTLPAESQLAKFEAMEYKMVDWLVSTPQYSGSSGNNFYAGLYMLGLAGAVDGIADSVRRVRMQAEIANIGAFLRASQLPSGGWGWATSLAADPMTTAVVGYALDSLNPSINAPYIRKAVDFLLSSQQPDGSWLSPSVASQFPGRDNVTAQAPTSWVNIWLPRVLDRVSGVDASLTLDLPANIVLKNPGAVPDATQPGNSFGGVSYTWKFKGDTDNLPVELGFDLELQNMLAGETRAVAAAGSLGLTDSLSGKASSIPIAIPSVSVPSGVAVATATDQASYPAHTDVVVTATVTNRNLAAQEAVVKFDIVDALGATVASLPVAGVALPGNGSASVSAVFNTGATLAGGYTVRASATSLSGAPLATSVGPFGIVAGAVKATAKISSDKTGYVSSDSVSLTARVGNAMSNDLLSDLSVVTTLAAQDGTAVFSKTEALPQLLSNAFKDYTYVANLVNAPLGQYKASVQVKAGDGSTLASSQIFVQVLAAPSLDVQGTLTATPAAVMVNQPVTLAAAITASAAVSNVPLTLAVVDPVTSTVLQQWTETVASLAAGATYPLAQQTWKAAGKSGDSLLAVLSASVGGKYVNLARQTLGLTPSLAQRVSGTLTLSSAAPMAGTALTLTGIITNNGDLDLSNLEVGVSVIDPLHPETVLFSQSVSGVGIAQGASSQASASWVVTGTPGVKLTAIYRAVLNGDVVELGRQDFVPVPPFVDSVSGTVTVSSLTPLPGELLTLTGTLNNTGTFSLAGIATRLSIVDPLVPDVPLFSQGGTVDLDAGTGKSTSATWAVAGALGTRLSAVFTATLNGQTVTVGKKDFVLFQKLADRIKGGVTLSSATPLSGDSLGISANVVNQTVVAIPGLAVRLMVVDPKAPDVALYSRIVTLELGGSQTQVVNGDWNVSAPSGSQLEVRVAATLGAESVLLASQPFSVKSRAVVSVTQHLGSRVLVYFSCRPDWDDHDRYKYWERKAPCFGERRQFIDDLLNSLDIPHLIVDDEEEFAEAFRSHRYNAYWLLGAYTHFSGKLVDELKESVFRGDALILDSGLHSWRNWDLLETAGVRYRGRLYCIGQEVNTLDKLFAPVSLSTEGWPLMLEAVGGVVEAVYQARQVRDVEDDDDDRQGERGDYKGKTSKPRATVFPAIVSNVYGKGRTLLFNFDLLDTLMKTKDGNWGVLARDAFAYLKPQDASISTLGGRMPVDIRLSGKEGDTTVKVQLTLPQGASLAESKPAASIENAVPTWLVALKKSETRSIQIALSGPVQPGEVHAVAHATDASSGAPIATLDHAYMVADAAQAAALASDALSRLNVAKNERSYRDKAIKNTGDAQADVKRRRYEQAIRELTEAAEFTARIESVDSTAARQAIDRLLRDVEIASLGADTALKPPVVFPPRNECKVHAGIIGKDKDRSLEIDFEPKAEDSGKNGDTFVAAALELDGAPRWFFLTSRGWALWQDGSIPKHSSGVLGAKTLRVLEKLDTSGFIGASIYVGYRVGAGEIKLYPAFTVR